ncbi:MAG TPA: YqgE/AlgH family protein [Pirellulaceae bacterium]|nr:YqgE/AlgH family protein [Pirellulaceae bacterium]
MINRITQFESQYRDLQGQLLVASSALHGTPFERTVVYVLQHNEDGVFGVVLNRPADQRLLDAWRQVSGDTQSDEEHLSCGGPIGGPVFAIHGLQDLGEMELNQGLFLSSAAESIHQVVRESDDRYRIFFGIAGWRPGQLEQELDKGLWYRMGGDASVVFTDCSFLWERSVLSVGRKTASELCGVRVFPPNPLFN